MFYALADMFILVNRTALHYLHIQSDEVTWNNIKLHRGMLPKLVEMCV